jgi:hypothetical protein
MRSIASTMSVKRGTSDRATIKTRGPPLIRSSPATSCAGYPGSDVDLAAEDAGGVLFNVHQFEQTELALFIVEKRSTSESSMASPRAVEPNM